MDCASFVHGMAWHDIAKPILLGNERHARLGYLLLEMLGYPQEALVALAHVSFKGGRCVLADHLTDYLAQPAAPDTLPAILALEHVLDRLAAASYSLMSDELPETIDRHAFLNPFSRLPLATAEFDPAPFITTLPALRAVFEDRLLGALDGDAALVDEVRAAIERSHTYTPAGDSLRPIPHGLSDERRAELLDLLLGFCERFPERTYHPVNDTSLASHTRLSAVLAFVLYRNLEAGTTGFLDRKIALNGGTVEIDRVPLPAFIDRRPPGAPVLPWSAAQALVRDHLDGVMVRVVFAAHRAIYESAVRLDDLTGARVLANRLRSAFAVKLAEGLGVSALAEQLWLNQSLFELVYFLPAALEPRLPALIDAAYDAACAAVVDEPADGLLSLLTQDFAGDNPLDFGRRRTELLTQLQVLKPSWGLAHLPAAAIPAANYDQFAVLYGQRLLEAYRQSQAAMTLSPAALDAVAGYLLAHEEAEIGAVCQVCNTNPVDVGFAQRLASTAPEDEVYRKATHLFRGQPEQLCISCVARRILSHARRSSPALERLLHLDAGSGRVWAEQPPAGAPGLPPGLVREAVCAPDDFVDMGAAYVRRNRRDPTKLEVFPTIGYACDAESNVALLSLAATDALYAAYDYSRLPALMANLPTANNDAHNYLHQTVIRFHDNVAKHPRGGAALARETLHAAPHIARVLQRIEFLDAFFRALPGLLSDAGLRTLALDWEFPHLRLLVPANQLDRALATLVEAVDVALFSFPVAAGSAAGEREVHRPNSALRAALLPALLRGAVIIFKQRQALYLVLEAERALLHVPPPRDAGYGFYLHLADMRGILSAAAWPQTAVTYGQLPETLRLLGKVDRRTILSAGVTLGRSDLSEETKGKVVAAELTVRSDWSRLKGPDLQALIADDAFRPVHFMKVVMKR